MRERLLPLVLISPLSGLLLGCQQTTAWPAVKQMIRAEFPRVEQISAADLNDWLESDEVPPLLLDTRQEAEYRVSHLRGAVRADPHDPVLPAEVGKGTPIVAYCSVGYRSSAVAELLMARGYTTVKNLEGSIFEWANRGFPVVRDGREVRQVHPYDRRWQSLLDKELRAYSAH